MIKHSQALRCALVLFLLSAAIRSEDASQPSIQLTLPLPDAKTDSTLLHVYSGKAETLSLSVSAPFSGKGEWISRCYLQSGDRLMPLENVASLPPPSGFLKGEPTQIDLQLSFPETKRILKVICTLGMRDSQGNVHPLPPPFRITVYPPEPEMGKTLKTTLKAFGPKPMGFGDPDSVLRQTLADWGIEPGSIRRNTPRLNESGTVWIGQVYPDDREFLLRELREGRKKAALVLLMDTDPETGTPLLHLCTDRTQTVIPVPAQERWNRPDFLHLLTSQLQSLLPDQDKNQ